MNGRNGERVKRSPFCLGMVRILAAATFFALAACNSGSDPSTDTNAASEEPAPAAPPAPNDRADGANDGYPNFTPPTLTPEAERTEAGARNVLLSFSRAIEEREWDQAWALLDPDTQSRWPESAWTRMFADLESITVSVPEGRMEGAAGTSYYTAPVAITAQDTATRPIRYDGEVVLKRVNDIPGATAAQLRWKIDSVTLAATH